MEKIQFYFTFFFQSDILFFFFNVSNYILFKIGSLVSFLASWFQTLLLLHTPHIYTTWALFLSSYTSAWSGFHTALSKSNLEYHPSAPPSLLNTPPCTYISLCARALTACFTLSVICPSSQERALHCITSVAHRFVFTCKVLLTKRTLHSATPAIVHKTFWSVSPPHHFHLSFNYT